METNGTSPRLGELLEYTDYLIMDFKHFDSDILRKYTGQGNEVIRANFEANCRRGRQQHIRIPLIKGINTQSPEGFADYFAAFDTANTVFEFLRYHEYGKDKWTTPYQVQDGFVTDDILQQFQTVFRAKGLKIVTT
jgi:pyruvate-formate lyase-activating enzyme